MNKLHSSILAIVMSIFLIQATDLPYEKESGKLIQNADVKIAKITNYNEYTTIINEELKEKTTETHKSNNEFLKQGEKSDYELLLEKDIVKPLLKLYQKDLDENVKDNTTNYLDATKRISKEDNLDDLKILSKTDIELLFNNQHIYQNPEEVDPQQISRRDDIFENNNNKDEHIGEILPNEYNNDNTQIYSRRNDYFRTPLRLRVQNYRKLYDYDDSFKPSSPAYLLPDSFRKAKYSGFDASSEGYETTGDDPTYRYSYRYPDNHETDETSKNYARQVKFNFPSNDNTVYRVPRRQRGYRDLFNDGRESRFEQQGTHQYQPTWNSARRPRVIFPSDLVAFREPNQEEPDYLAGDTNLQDIQQPDLRDRG